MNMEVFHLITKKSRSLIYTLAALLIVVLIAVSGCGTPKAANTAAAPDNTFKRPDVVSSGDQAKELLISGNTRFTKGELTKKDLGSKRREELTAGQKPFAVVLTCSDSRVPPELLFDQGLGDIFVIRVAGNVVDPIVLGSVEYAVEHLHAPLVVVLGHEKCGAVAATVAGGEAPGSIGSIVSKIQPSVAKAKASSTDGDLVEKAADENIKAMIAEVGKSHIVKEFEESGKLKVLGAKYHLGSGQVEWFNAAK